MLLAELLSALRYSADAGACIPKALAPGMSAWKYSVRCPADKHESSRGKFQFIYDIYIWLSAPK